MLTRNQLELMDPLSDIVRSISEYVASVLTALGFRHGAGHSEVILTSRGPILVETAARIMGAQDPLTVVTCTGSSHALQTVQAFANAQALEVQFDRSPKVLFKYCLGVTLMNRKTGQCTAPIDWKFFQALPSFMGLKKSVEAGDHVPATKDMFTTVGGVYLVASNRDQLWQDYLAIRNAESGNIYNIH